MKYQTTTTVNSIFVLILLLVTSLNVVAQDNIIRNNGNEINAKVVEINQQNIIYQTESGAKFTMSAKDVFMIQYENGTTDLFRDGRVTSSTERKPVTETSPPHRTSVVIQPTQAVKTETVAKPQQSEEIKATESASATNRREEILNNDAIITLFKKGFSTAIILGKMKRTAGDYDMSMEALVRLKDLKVPDAIINAMMETERVPKIESPKTETQKFEPEKVVAVTDAVSVMESGIYYQQISNGKAELKELEPSVSAKSVTDSGLGASYTYGAVSTKTRARFDGTMARLRINERRPVFYFYFDQGNSLSNANAWFTPTSNPNEFLLVKMTIVKKSREFITGSMNRWAGNEWGVEEKSRISFTVEKIKPGIYKVTPNTALLSGEYCFMYAGNAVHYGMTGQKVFDFGVY